MGYRMEKMSKPVNGDVYAPPLTGLLFIDLDDKIVSYKAKNEGIT